MIKADRSIRAYYNEIDPKACAWLEQLMSHDLITPGRIDDRSIEDVLPDDLSGFDRVHFFAGIGVWDYALNQAGWSRVPVWTGSCPCQPFSTAGKGKGFADERHLWPAFHHLIRHAKPPDVPVFGEQVASKDGLAWLDLVQSDMEGTGYAFGAADTCAAGFGAPHIRQRLYWVADADDPQRGPEESPWHHVSGPQTKWHEGDRHPWQRLHESNWLPYAASFRQDPYGDSCRMGRLRGYGNAIVAPQAQAFVEAFMSYRMAA